MKHMWIGGIDLKLDSSSHLGQEESQWAHQNFKKQSCGEREWLETNRGLSWTARIEVGKN